MIGSRARVLLIGAGGLGSPAALVLARSIDAVITIADDDVVDATNLHRQTLFGADDVGQPKARVAAARIVAEGRAAGRDVDVRPLVARVTPDNAREIVGSYDVVIEGADNFATKFLAADACALARVPVVSAGAVRWSGWALAAVPGESACLRCVFEDIPRDRAETCAEAGVVGPVVGVIGALEAALALRVLRGERDAAGELWSYRALEGALRKARVSRRAGCPLCAGEVRELTIDRYVAPECAV